jgi:peptidyl-prolyl cis-trans isomerase B (cyclophilin B)
MGDITVEFFDDVAPKAVENFLTHAEEGYYDNLLFHRVIDNFMIQSGDPNGDGTGGESIWGDPFENEISDNAYNLRGALCMANRSDTVSNGSQFYIVQADVVSESQFTTYESYGYTFTDTQKELYEQYGGAPWLDGDYTVFGQVIDGMDVVDAIAAVSVDTSNKPLEDVVLESIEVTTYTAE